MKIAIIAAMGKELALLLPMMSNRATVTLNDYTYHTGTIAGRDVVAVQSGIGKVNAAIAALTLIDNFHPSLVINTGVAGGTGHGAGILDVIIPDRIVYHDVWCGPGTDHGQAAGCPLFFECPLPPELISELGARSGLLASGDIFVAHPDDVKRILGFFPEAVAVDMESAAIAQVCSIKNVPFVAIRVISDTPGAAENISQYENFWNDAPAHTFATLEKLLAAV